MWDSFWLLFRAFSAIGRWAASFSAGDWWAYCSALIVFLGVVGETVCDLTKWIKSESQKEKVKIGSALVLILGLAGDIVSIHVTRMEEARIIKDAGDAKQSARTAKELADKIAERAERLSWLMDAWARQINFRQLDLKRFVDLMKGKPKGSAEIWYVPDDDEEPEMFAYQIRQGLGKDGAGWVVSDVHALPPSATPHPEDALRKAIFDDLRLEAKEGLGIGTQEIGKPGSDNPYWAFDEALVRCVSSMTITIRSAEFPTLPKGHLIIIVGHRRMAVGRPDFLRSKP